MVVPLLCATNQFGRYPSNNDGMPITFAHPVAGGPATIEPSVIAVTLNDGSVVNPYCVTAAPAREGNEMQTYLTVGTFGDGRGEALYPIKIEVVGDLMLQPGEEGAPQVNAKGSVYVPPGGLRYTGGLMVVQANLQQFSESGEGGSNSCGATFPGLTISHRIQVVWSGGATLDGVNELTPQDTHFFKVFLDDSSELSGGGDVYVGVADIGDGDNFHDLCLNLPASVEPHIHSIRTPCEIGKTAFYPPKGIYGAPCADVVVPVQRTVYGSLLS